MAHLIFCGVSDQTLGVCESNIAGSSSVAHIICDDFYAVILPNAHATILQKHKQAVRSRTLSTLMSVSLTNMPNCIQSSAIEE